MIQTMGLVDVLNKKSFETVLHACYTDPLHIDTCTLCLLYLVFAIGLVFANPAPDTEEAKMIDCLRNDENTNWAETFYRSAKLLQDPVSGFEDADLWSVQALVLMSLYTLAISKRNAAYAYHGEYLAVSPYRITHSSDDDVQAWLLDPLWLSAYTGRRHSSPSQNHKGNSVATYGRHCSFSIGSCPHRWAGQQP